MIQSKPGVAKSMYAMAACNVATTLIPTMRQTSHAGSRLASERELSVWFVTQNPSMALAKVGKVW